MNDGKGLEYKNEFEIIKENYRFLPDDQDDEQELSSLEIWKKNLVNNYNDKLYKEYAIIDLSKYKSNEIGLRWRTEDEVIKGKGQFTCGNRKCKSYNLNSQTNTNESLKSFEVPFSYIENKVPKKALIKVVLCQDCGKILNYTNIKKKKKELKKYLKEQKKKETKKRSRESDSDSDSNNNDNHNDNDNVSDDDKELKKLKVVNDNNS